MPRWEDVTSRMLEHRAFAHRQAGRRRGARRDLHHPGREGRRPQPDELERRRPSASRRGRRTGMGLVLQRQVGRVQAGPRVAGRPRAAARDRPRQAEALLHAVVVARLEEDSLQRHRSQGLGARRRQRAGEGRRPRSVDGAAADAQSGLEPRLEVGRVCEPAEHALPRDLREQRRDRRDEAGDRWAGRRDVPGLGRQRQVPVVPRVDRLRAAARSGST